MKQYVQTDLEAGRRFVTTLAELHEPRQRPFPFGKGPLA